LSHWRLATATVDGEHQDEEPTDPSSDCGDEDCFVGARRRLLGGLFGDGQVILSLLQGRRGGNGTSDEKRNRRRRRYDGHATAQWTSGPIEPLVAR
jgi:hypothetical protein